MAGAGLFVGALAAPEFEPKAFRYPALWQSAFGGAAGAIFGLLLSKPIDTILICAGVGGLIGFLAPYWVKHIQPP